MTNVPKKLNKKEFRFIKLRGQTKMPLEKNWSESNNYDYDEITKWGDKGNNYGVATGYGNLGVIDCDVEILDKRVKDELPETFTVQTGSGGKHYYYIIDDLDKKFIFFYKGTIHAGELQWKGQQVVGAGSTHPESGLKYKVVKNKPIAHISKKDLQGLFKEFEKAKDKEKNGEPKKNDDIHKGFVLPITKVVEQVPELQRFIRKGKDLQGAHPVHGSTTRINFCIDDENDLWHCFRCGTGGDTLTLIAMLEGIVNCGDVKPGCLKGDKFKKTIKVAKKKYGFTDEELKIQELPEEPKSLDDVYKTFKEWMYIEDTDPIDLVLATALSSQKKGTPVWMILVGASSGGKSQFIRALSDIPNSMLQDDITPNTLASGARIKGKKVEDLGMKLEGKSTIVLTSDLASLTSQNKDEKRKIWAKFRELFDGYIKRGTGNGVFIDYKDCHVTWIFGATPTIRSEVLIYAQLGTRELMYELKLPENIDDLIMEKAWDNEDYEERMKKEMKSVVRKFYKSHTYKEKIEVPDSMKRFIKNEAKRLEYMRASAPTDMKTGELITNISVAKPHRAMKQLKKIYIALKSLSDNYPDVRAARIIRQVVDSTSDPVRNAMMYLHEDNPEMEFTVSKYHSKLRLGTRTVKRQAMALWNMGYLIREDREMIVAGKQREVPHFRKNPSIGFKFIRTSDL